MKTGGDLVFRPRPDYERSKNGPIRLVVNPPYGNAEAWLESTFRQLIEANDRAICEIIQGQQIKGASFPYIPIPKIQLGKWPSTLRPPSFRVAEIKTEATLTPEEVAQFQEVMKPSFSFDRYNGFKPSWKVVRKQEPFSFDRYNGIARRS